MLQHHYLYLQTKKRNMKSKKLQFIYLLAFCSIAYFVFSSSSGGITGQAASGCGGGGCHTAGNTTITLTGIPATYVYGTTYVCTLNVTNMSKAAAGFDLTVNIGTLTAGAGTQLSGSTEIFHNAPKMAISGTTTWTFNWTAPASGGALNVAVAGNAVDNTGTSANDAFATSSFSFAAPAGAAAPTIANATATSITQNSAVVNADVTANNAATTASIEYGLTASYGSTASMTPASITGNTPTPATGNISGLNAGTLYHYRVKAVNASGVTTSADATFTTLVAASVNSIEKTSIEVFPNPVVDYIMYRNMENQGNVSFSIVSVNGASQNVQIEKLNNGNYKIQTNSLANGNYVLLMELDGKKYVHHFSK